MMQLSYAITVHDEIDELRRLVQTLSDHLRPDEEIVIQYDSGRVTQPVLAYIETISRSQNRFSAVCRAFDNDFAAFKNNLNAFCKGQYIFQIDADEYPAASLLLALPRILRVLPSVDVIYLPRINTVAGLTAAHAKQWDWRLSAEGWVNFPDPQGRIYRNCSTIKWKNPVHECLSGYRTHTNLPWTPDMALHHHKSITRQEVQNAFYSSLCDARASQMPLPSRADCKNAARISPGRGWQQDWLYQQ